MSNILNKKVGGGISVLSLFDGMSCGMLAFLGLDIKVDNYYAYEIDKYAIQTTQHNFPNVEELGDVFEADFTKYKDIDFLVGGSPCTYWSIAQKNDNREVEASGLGWDLFSQYVRAIREVKPKAFLYENNKSMSRAIYESISETFGFEPIMIDSALVSAQSRKRYYWCGILQDDGSYRKANISQPEDRGIILRDIINADREKSRAIIGSIGRTTTREYFKKHQGQMAFEPINIINGATGVSEPLSPKQVGSLPRPNGELSTSQAFRVYDIDHKSVGLKANGGGAGGKTGLYAIPVEFEDNKPIKAVSATDGKTYPVYFINEGQIEIKGKLYPIKLNDGYYIIRKLTVDECKMLQTVPDWYEFPVSDSQAYKMLGNGWTVEVIKHLLYSIINDV